MKRNHIKNIYFVSMAICLSGIIILLAIVWLNYALLVGWIVGCFASLIGFLINHLVTTKLLKPASKKRTVVILIILKVHVALLIQAGILIAIIFINKAVGSSYIHVPINIFTYIAGINIFLVGTIVSQLVFRRK